MSELAELGSLTIAHDFQGVQLRPEHHAVLRLRREADQLCVEVDAPFYGEPPPAAPVGATDRLWEHEVCELFIADGAQHYLEIELSPHGHHLVLELSGVRHVVRSQLPIDFTVHIARDPDRSRRVACAQSVPQGRYRGVARVSWHYLPEGAVRANAYLIHGSASRRCYHAHRPTLGEVADFHQLASFAPFSFA
jgi:hypothetical protein